MSNQVEVGKAERDALYEVCCDEHARCSARCPVFLVNGGVPDSAHDFEVNRGCDCFKDGRKMYWFLRRHGVSAVDVGGEVLDLTGGAPKDTGE